jgi:hypothetical protein
MRGSDIEMSLIDTRGIVATVANKKALRYWPIFKKPREAMGFLYFPIIVDHAVIFRGDGPTP